MPLTTIELAPGVNTQVTETQGMAQIVESDLIRFKSAGNKILPEKLGGWEKFYPSALGSTPRALHAWEGINSDTHLAAGCEEELIIISDGVAEDVTPQTYTSDIAPAFTTTNADTEVQIDDTNITANVYDSIFIVVPVSIGGIVLYGAYQIESVIDADSYTIIAAAAATSTAGPGGAVPSFATTNGSSIVTVTLNNHGYSVGETFPAAVSTTVGGLTIFGNYIIQTVPTANTFTIIAASQASSTTSGSMNGGDTQIIYYIGGAPPPGSTGYGIGGYGSGGYGTGSSIPASAGTPITATNWTLDNWGEVLIATPAGQSIFTWSPDSGFPLAVRIIEGPLIAGGAFVSQPAQILVAWGASFSGVPDPLAVHWSDAGDYSNWTVSSVTQAGGFRIPTGSKIVGACAGPSFGIIWSDLEVWSMEYIEPPLIFGFNSIASACGMISRHGYATLNTTIYWMGYKNFFMMRGESVQTIPCSVWDYVFQDLDTSAEALDRIYAGANTLFGEIWFFFPSASGGTGEVDKYVKFNPDLGTWDTGVLARSAWIDQSPVGEPIGAMPTGFLQQHEISPDDDGQPMLPFFKTGFFQVADGDNLQFIDWMIPDAKWGYIEGDPGAILQVTIYYADYPATAVKTVGPFSVSEATEYVNFHLRGRFVSLEISSSDLGSWWRWGAFKFRGAPDGKR